MPRTLLILGGGVLAAPALRFAREAGLAVVLADPDPRARSRRLADEFHALPRGDADSHRSLVRRLAREGRLAGVYAADAESLALLPALADGAGDILPPRGVLTELARDGGRAKLAAGGVALAPEDAEPVLVVLGFFRDGAFVPAGSARRETRSGGDVLGVQPGLALASEARAAYVLAERAAHCAGIEVGPLTATLAATPGGLAVVRLDAGFAEPVLATHVAPLAHGKSPLQAWCAHLADAGGPFDELPLDSRAHAGWLALHAPGLQGLFGGLAGAARARAVPGIATLWIEEPGRELGAPASAGAPLALLVASGDDREQLEDRLRRARAALEVRVACLRVA
jgi:hypothetical protein